MTAIVTSEQTSATMACAMCGMVRHTAAGAKAGAGRRMGSGISCSAARAWAGRRWAASERLQTRVARER